MARAAGIIGAALLICLPVTWLAATPASAAGGPWPVYHHDAARTGVADAGPSLSTPIQRWKTPNLDGQIFAEPVVSGSIVIVATENDTVYGLDAGNGGVVWSHHLANPAPLSDVHKVANCGDIDPLGITSTPVIDQTRGEAFVAAEVDAGGNVTHQLFGLNVANGQTMLQATQVDPSGLIPAAEQQRAALALGNGRVYVNYGGLDGDCGPYKGAVDSVTEDGGSPVQYIVPTTREGGMWATSGPAISSTGDVYVSAGNGAQTDPSQPFDGSDSVTQLSSTLTFKSIFAPSSWAADNAADADLGSTGPEPLQNGQLVQIGKRGDAYLLNASNLGGVGKQLGVTHICPASFGGQAYAAPTIYITCTDGVRAVQVNAGNNGFNVLWQGPSAATGPPILGGGLVWVIGNDQSMYGLDPGTGSTVAHFGIPASNHFVTPTVADGELLAGTGLTVEAFDEGPTAPPGAPEVSSPQFGVANQTDVFTVAGNGAVEVRWIDGSGAFHGPLAISAPGVALLGAHLAASAQFGVANQTDVFVVGNDGATRVLWVEGAGNWNGPLAISPPALAPAGAGLAASPQFGVANQTDVFVVGNDGAARVLWVESAGNWNGPLAISPGLAPAGAHLAASPQFGVANQTDVFVIGNDGAARVVWVEGAGHWNGPLAISGAGVAPPGAHLAASPQFAVANQTDVFVVGGDGAARVVWVESAGNWNGPLAISPPGVAPAGAGLAASEQFGIANQTDVFVVGGDGAARVVWVEGIGHWNGPLAISPTSLAEAGGHLAASQQFNDANRTDVFVVSTVGTTEVVWVEVAGSWNGPLPL